MLNRRAFPYFSILALLVLALPIALAAQSGTTHRVGVVRTRTPEGDAYFQTFLAAMRALGYVEGQNLTVVVRYVDRDHTGLSATVDELIALKPDVMVGWESTAQAMRAKTTSIPIVLSGAIDPVKAGLARSLRRPGLNVTGSAQLNDQLPEKHLEIAREILPSLAKVGQFVDKSASGCKAVEERSRQAAQRLGVIFVPYYVSNRTEIEQAYSQMEEDRPDVLMGCPSIVLFNNRDLLFASAVRLRVPFTSFVVANLPMGVLFAYASSLHEHWRRAAVYVDRILKGAAPGDLPIEQPTKFELVINLKTARALGLTVPPSLLLRADQVIE